MKGLSGAKVTVAKMLSSDFLKFLLCPQQKNAVTIKKVAVWLTKQNEGQTTQNRILTGLPYLSPTFCTCLKHVTVILDIIHRS